MIFYEHNKNVSWDGHIYMYVCMYVCGRCSFIFMSVCRDISNPYTESNFVTLILDLYEALNLKQIFSFWKFNSLFIISDLRPQTTQMIWYKLIRSWRSLIQRSWWIWKPFLHMFLRICNQLFIHRWSKKHKIAWSRNCAFLFRTPITYVCYQDALKKYGKKFFEPCFIFRFCLCPNIISDLLVTASWCS